MERLYLTHALQRNLYGNLVFNPPSRFLQEIPSELIDSVSCQKCGIEETENWEDIRKDENWSAGDFVYHKKWGQGKIKEISKSGEDQVLTVFFPEVGTKVVLAAYAPLKKVQQP